MKTQTTEFEIIEQTNHWTIEQGWFLRDCWVRTADGRVALYGIPDGRVGGTR